MNELALIFRWSALIGGDPKHGQNEQHMLRQIARVRGHETVANMSELDALRAIASSYGKSNVGYMNELDALRAIVDGMGAKPSNRNLHDMNEIDCLWAIIRAGGGAAAFDADAADYFARVVANVGTISDATKTAVNAYFVGTKSDGDWDLITRGSLLCGDQLAAALVPFKVGGGNATDTNNNFVEGDYSEATGLTGNGSTKYLNTGLLGSVLTANDTHLAVYNRGSSAVGGSVGIGASSALNLYAPFSDGRSYSYQYDNVEGSAISTLVLGTPFGFVLSTRTAANSHIIYRNGISVGNDATIGGTMATIALYVFANNNAGAANNFTAHNFAAYFIGKGVSAAAVVRMNARTEAFQDALGRGVQ